MNEITRQIEALRNEQDGIVRDMRGINPKLGLYATLLKRKDRIDQEINDLREKRGDRLPVGTRKESVTT